MYDALAAQKTNYYTIGTFLNDQDEDEIIADTEVTPDVVNENIELEPNLLCSHCGLIQPEGPRQCSCTSGSLIRVEKVNLGRSHTLRRCVSCSTRHSKGVVYRFLTGQDAPVSVLADALYQHIPPSKDENSEELPGQGRKMLNFTDSRQNAAFFAPYLERAHNRNLRRRMIVYTLQNDLDGAKGNLTLNDMLDRLIYRTRKVNLFPQETDSELEKHMAIWFDARVFSS